MCNLQIHSISEITQRKKMTREGRRHLTSRFAITIRDSQRVESLRPTCNLPLELHIKLFLAGLRSVWMV